ncbi:hypothetical protein [Microbacterium sp. Clip185]|uniref:hypothetical protein n=1 Tax=Microbacterium sp. Clip185 TaxID=3025663 RepID=UPI002365E5DD|nr:hypothetical protein [Microbacterium sp. Clip185]WDG18110.1 hypothetical protein PQV94_16010 [Microbacterium sp. Clip185]
MHEAKNREHDRGCHPDSRYKAIARTLYAQLTPETREYLGIAGLTGNSRTWYGRYWRAVNRIFELTYPWEVNRKSHATAEAYQVALDSYSQKKRDRSDYLMNLLVQAPLGRLPQEIRDTYAGNVALDATLIEIAGRTNPNASSVDLPRRNLDAMAGAYRRGGNHDGQGAKTDKAGWEMETVVTVPNSPKQPQSFPILTTALALHHPGRTKHGPRIAMEFHANKFDERGLILVDRLYNGSKAHRFQKPTRQMGFRHVYDYKLKQTGRQGGVDDVILVDGRLYVKWMPEHLQTVRADFKAGLITREVHDKRLASRAQYELKDKGRPDADGRQYFFYPDLRKVMCFDPATGNRLTRTPKTPTTFLLSPDDAVSMRIIRHLNRFAYKTPEWREWYGMRSHVESNNQYVKADAETDLGNPDKHRPRGYAFQAFNAAIAFAVANMRRIVSFIQAQAMKVLDARTLQRARRRTDELGNRLPHRDL